MMPDLSYRAKRRTALVTGFCLAAAAFIATVAIIVEALP